MGAATSYDRNYILDPPPNAFARVLNIVGLVQGALLLTHSFYQHGLVWKSSRKIADLCSLSSMLMFATQFWGFHGGRCWVFFLFGVYFTDSLIFVNRYLLVKKKTKTWVCTLIYVFLALEFVMWLPEIVFMPLAVNMNTPFYRAYVNLAFVVSSLIKTLFNATFSVVFFLMIRKYKKMSDIERSTRRNYTIYTTSIKAIIHFLTSVLATIISAVFVYKGAWRLSIIIIPNQVHFLFNYKLEENFLLVGLYKLIFDRDKKISPESYLVLDLDTDESEDFEVIEPGRNSPQQPLGRTGDVEAPVVAVPVGVMTLPRNGPPVQPGNGYGYGDGVKSLAPDSVEGLSVLCMESGYVSEAEQQQRAREGGSEGGRGNMSMVNVESRVDDESEGTNPL